MSKLDDVMLERIIHIVNEEHTNFSYKNFIDLMKPKTYRNKISKLKEEGIVKLDYKSSFAFHTLKGRKFGKSGIRNPTGVTISNNDPLYNMLKNLKMDKPSIHDIDLKFNATGIYETFERTPFRKYKKNESVAVNSWIINNAITRITINKNDSVNVIIGCSLEPIPLDYFGIIRFLTILSRSEGVLHGLTAVVNNYPIGNKSIPSFTKWIITRWELGRDAIESYKGEKFEIAVKDAMHMLIRLYAKDFGKNMTRLRAERIETPRKTVIDAINEKLNLDNTMSFIPKNSELPNIGIN